MNETLPISVMMSTYSKVEPVWLRDAIFSLVCQILPPNEIIIIIDGPVSNLQHEILNSFKNNNKIIKFKLIESEVNSGLAASMNIALQQVSNIWVARMDSDDICRNDRFKIQYQTAIENEADVICSWHSEFLEDVSLIHAIKKTPNMNSQILRQLNYRNVISHPTILMRTDLLKKIGGYDASVGFLEDYDLYLKLAASGAIFYAIQEPLVFVRVSKDQIARRGGFNYLLKELSFRWFALLKGYITLQGFFVGVTIYPIFRLLPVWLKFWLYKLVRSSA